MDITEEEIKEYEQKLQMANDIKWLMSNDQFKRVIVNAYVNETALNVGIAYSGSDGDVTALKSITHISDFLAVNSVSPEKIQ